MYRNHIKLGSCLILCLVFTGHAFAQDSGGKLPEDQELTHSEGWVDLKWVYDIVLCTMQKSWCYAVDTLLGGMAGAVTSVADLVPPGLANWVTWLDASAGYLFLADAWLPITESIAVLGAVGGFMAGWALFRLVMHFVFMG